jgi:hypothetical protein
VTSSSPAAATASNTLGSASAVARALSRYAYRAESWSSTITPGTMSRMTRSAIRPAGIGSQSEPQADQ